MAVSESLDRAAFLDAVDGAIREASEEGASRLWVALLSFPSLRLLRATLSVDEYDEVLDEIQAFLRREYPEIVALSRLAWDEVVVAAMGPYQRLSRRTTPQVRRRFSAERIPVRGVPIFLNVRVGFCTYWPGDDAAELLRRSRVASIVARRPGEDDVQIYDDRMDRRIAGEAKLLSELLAALDKNELQVAYQPKVDLETGRFAGAETLVRWPEAAERGIGTQQLIHVAERSGSVVPLGSWVLRGACRQAAQWRLQGLPRFRVAVNVSRLQLFSTDLVSTVRLHLEAHDLPPEWLELEITESGMVEDDKVVSAVGQLHELGVAVSLDDFGTGLSSLSRLWSMPISRLKIDRSFIRRCPSAQGDRCLIRGIARIGRELDMRVVAEGTETEAQVAYVRDAGCHEAQGYYFAPALPPAELVAFMAERGT